MPITIADALPEEAEALSAILIASITELCTREHGGDPDLLAGWLANKTPDHVRRWIERGRTHILTARQSGEIAGIGATNALGEILLNYVAPSHRGAGVSTALLAAMEADVAAGGHDVARLISTLTAHAFHLNRGWQDDGPEITEIGLAGQPMVKRLAPA